MKLPYVYCSTRSSVVAQFHLLAPPKQMPTIRALNVEVAAHKSGPSLTTVVIAQTPKVGSLTRIHINVQNTLLTIRSAQVHNNHYSSPNPPQTWDQHLSQQVPTPIQQNHVPELHPSLQLLQNWDQSPPSLLQHPNPPVDPLLQDWNEHSHSPFLPQGPLDLSSEPLSLVQHPGPHLVQSTQLPQNWDEHSQTTSSLYHPAHNVLAMGHHQPTYTPPDLSSHQAASAQANPYHPIDEYLATPWSQISQPIPYVDLQHPTSPIIPGGDFASLSQPTTSLMEAKSISMASDSPALPQVQNLKSDAPSGTVPSNLKSGSKVVHGDKRKRSKGERTPARREYERLYRLRERLQKNHGDLKDHKKFLEVEAEIKIWGEKNPYMFGLCQEELKGKHDIWAGLKDQEIDILKLGFMRNFMIKHPRDKDPPDVEQTQRSLMVVEDNKYILDEPFQSKLREELKEWKEKQRLEDPEGLKRFNWNVAARRVALRNAQLDERQRELLQLVYERDCMWTDQHGEEFEIVNFNKQAQAAMKILEDNKDLRDKKVQEEVEAEFEEWKNKLRTNDPGEFQFVKWKMAKKVAQLNKMFKDKLTEEEKRILRLAFERGTMLKSRS
ncbi:hypothetical protein H0H93_006253 [Arthromyces matolae]|nr:hypothetical protein H0H93_006253 [Arthromyces matolae]